MIGVAKIYSSSFPGSHLNIFWSPNCSQFHPYKSRSINPYDESFDLFPILFLSCRLLHSYRFDSYHSLHVETEDVLLSSLSNVAATCSRQINGRD